MTSIEVRADSEATRQPVGHRVLSAEDKQAAADKLRARGWSYRRIAEALHVQYGLVSRWLSGEPAIPRPTPVTASARRPAEPAEPVAAEASAAEAPAVPSGPPDARLTARLVTLLEAIERDRAVAAERDRRLVELLGRIETMLAGKP